MISCASVRNLVVVLVVAALTVCAAPTARGAQTLRTYFVGNSLTNQMDPASIGSLAASRGNSLVFGKHIDFGQALEQMWGNPGGADETVSPYDTFPNALANHQWDAVSLQPFMRPIEEPIGDRIALRNFISLARTRSPGARFFLYSGWPFKYAGQPMNYPQRWVQPFSGSWDDTIRTRDFYAKLVGAARQDFPSVAQSIVLVPTGEVMFELDRRMRQGLVPGYDDVAQLYSDELHLNETGRYLCALTFYATMFKQDPRGLPYDPAVITDPAWRRSCRTWRGRSYARTRWPACARRWIRWPGRSWGTRRSRRFPSRAAPQAWCCSSRSRLRRAGAVAERFATRRDDARPAHRPRIFPALAAPGPVLSRSFHSARSHLRASPNAGTRSTRMQMLSRRHATPVEPLETRRLLAAALGSDGTLTVTGSNARDIIEFDLRTPTRLKVEINDRNEQFFSYAQVQRIVATSTTPMPAARSSTAAATTTARTTTLQSSGRLTAACGFAKSRA